MVGLFINIDSGVRVSRADELVCTNSWVYSYVHDVPVYLVSPDTMDRVCPPDWSAGIPLGESGAVKELIDSFLQELGEDIGERLERVYRGLERYVAKFPCDGVFMDRGPSVIDDYRVSYPAIYVTPERILESVEEIARRHGISVRRVFRQLLKSCVTHEYTHALNWRNSKGLSIQHYSKEHVKVFEELTAQLTAYANLSTPGRAFFTMKSANQPIEYNTWKALIPLCEGLYRTASYSLTHLWSRYLLGKKPPLIGLLLLPHPWVWLTIPFHYDLYLGMLHELSIRYGYHRFYHEVIEPLYRNITRGTSTGKKIAEKLLKITALLLIRMVL